jgi:hypothetical protein
MHTVVKTNNNTRSTACIYVYFCHHSDTHFRQYNCHCDRHYHYHVGAVSVTAAANYRSSRHTVVLLLSYADGRCPFVVLLQAASTIWVPDRS